MDQTDTSDSYDKRWQRIEDAVRLREPDRVPFVYLAHFWAARLGGYSYQEMMYDVDKYIDVNRKAMDMLQPDAYSALMFAHGKTLEGIGYLPMQWPGHGVDANATFQYLDREFMSAGEYDDYLFDPTGYYLHTYLPRVSDAYKVFELLPDYSACAEWDLITAVSGFADERLQQGLQHLFQVGKDTAYILGQTGKFVDEMKAAGYPLIAGGFCKAPYDLFADFMRGSKGAMLDMFRNKDKLLAAMAKARVLLLKNVERTTKLLGCPYVFMPLHWGLDGFMSADQFRTFYWPELRNTMLALIEKDLVPCLLWEGKCDSRLEIIADIPPGKAMYWFEGTDMFRAKEILGDIVCLRGNVPSSLLNVGTPDEVDAYCRKLIEQVGRGGGFILDGAIGIPDEAKPENVLAMAASVKKYS